MRTDAQFIFQSYESIKNGTILTFHYVLTESGNTYHFKEIIRLPRGTTIFSIPKPIQTKILENLLLVLGISYWKTFCPRTMIIRPFSLTKKQSEFWNTVYKKGLGEFFYKNKIDFRNLIRFPYKKTAKNSTVPRIKTMNESLLLWGGGKDSIVAGELLKSSRKRFLLFAINPVSLQKTTARLMEKPMVAIRRELDPQLFLLNQKGVYNGHIPASAVYAFLGILAALLQKKRYIIAANEESANYGNVKFLGKEINHQWSKSYEFEKIFREYIKANVSRDIEYFSLMRPLTELEIAKIFSQMPKYFSSFSSCNRNFSITKPKKNKLWCGKCPKCAFVFALLAAYLPKKQLIAIFQKNLFADESLLPLYKELLGLTSVKPFECVGTPEETKAAFRETYARGKFQESPIMKFFVRSVLPTMKKDRMRRQKTAYYFPK